MKNYEVTLPPLHATQAIVARCDKRFIVLPCGRRWGKTRLGAHRCMTVALEGGAAWWVAPTYLTAQIGWRLLKRLARQIPAARVSEGAQMITTASGGWVQARSADNPDSLRGEGLDFVVLDECAFLVEEAWTKALRPTLSDRHGKAMFISTPKGRNWFYRLNALAEAQPDDWASFRFVSTDNPWLDPAEVETARRDLPELVFRQEYLAEFIQDGAGVFRYVRAAVRPPLPVDESDKQYVMGIDFGRSVDYTVVVTIETTSRHVCHVDRYTGLDWLPQMDRIVALVERYRPKSVLAEQNSMGGPVISQLRRRGVPVLGFTTDNTSKQLVIDQLALAFEHHSLTIPNDPILINELEAFEYKSAPGGLVRYGAPSGVHDDTVIALALANHGLLRPDARSLIDFA